MLRKSKLQWSERIYGRENRSSGDDKNFNRTGKFYEIYEISSLLLFDAKLNRNLNQIFVKDCSMYR